MTYAAYTRYMDKSERQEFDRKLAAPPRPGERARPTGVSQSQEALMRAFLLPQGDG